MSRFATPVVFLATLSLLTTCLAACDSSGGDDPEEDTTAPAAPSGMEGSSEDGAVSLTWSAPPANDVDVYNIYRSTNDFSSTGGAQQVGGDGLTETSYRDSAAENGTRYYYRVTAVDEDGNESNLSESIAKTPLPDPPGDP